MMPVAVKFLRTWHGYNSGEVAGFDELMAERLIQAGVAVRCAEPARETATIEPPETAMAIRTRRRGPR